MSRGLAAALVLVMLLVVAGQALLLGRIQSQPVTQISLHESRLLMFLQEIRSHNPTTYDSTVLNLVRLRDGQAQGQNIAQEEAVVAEELLKRLAAPSP